MRCYFKSDAFAYLHPTESPCRTSECSKRYIEEACANMEKFHINEELLDTAVYESDGELGKDRIGTIILFPEVPKSDGLLMEGFIKDVFGRAEAQLGEEYNDAGDPTMFWETGIDGRHFDGTAVNKSTGETFGKDSPTIYIAGCTPMTAEYLAEMGIDAMYTESAKHDKKAAKSGGDKIEFGRYKSFLIYHVGNGRFYQFGTHESRLWHSEDRSKGRPDYRIYSLVGES